MRRTFARRTSVRAAAAAEKEKHSLIDKKAKNAQKIRLLLAYFIE